MYLGFPENGRNVRQQYLMQPTLDIGHHPPLFETRDYHPLRYGVPADLSSQKRDGLLSKPHISNVLPRQIRFALCGFRSTLHSPHLITMSFPPGTRMLRFPGCPFFNRTIRRSRDQPLPAGPPCFSQLATSFFGSQTQPFTNWLLDFIVRSHLSNFGPVPAGHYSIRVSFVNDPPPFMVNLN